MHVSSLCAFYDCSKSSEFLQLSSDVIFVVVKVLRRKLFFKLLCLSPAGERGDKDKEKKKKTDEQNNITCILLLSSFARDGRLVIIMIVVTIKQPRMCLSQDCTPISPNIFVLMRFSRHLSGSVFLIFLTSLFVA